jgi:hypothetical protein
MDPKFLTCQSISSFKTLIWVRCSNSIIAFSTPGFTFKPTIVRFFRGVKRDLV